MAILVSEDLGFYLEFCDKLYSFGKLSEFHSKIIDLSSKKISRYRVTPLSFRRLRKRRPSRAVGRQCEAESLTRD